MRKILNKKGDHWSPFLLEYANMSNERQWIQLALKNIDDSNDGEDNGSEISNTTDQSIEWK